jgi:hypothetical protein
MPLEIMAVATNHGSAEQTPGLFSDQPRNGELLFPRAIEVLSVSSPPTYQYAISGVGINVLLSQTSCGSKVPRTTSFQFGYT